VILDIAEDSFNILLLDLILAGDVGELVPFVLID